MALNTKPWFRFYKEFAYNPRIQNMNEAFQRRLVMLFCLKCDGLLPGLEEEEIAGALKIPMKELEKTKKYLVNKGIVTDEWDIPSWNVRQYESDSSAERTRRYRKRKCDDVTAKGRHRSVTRVTPVTLPDTDTDTEDPPLPPQGEPDPPKNGSAPASDRELETIRMFYTCRNQWIDETERSLKPSPIPRTGSENDVKAVRILAKWTVSQAVCEDVADYLQCIFKWIFLEDPQRTAAGRNFCWANVIQNISGLSKKRDKFSNLLGQYATRSRNVSHGPHACTSKYNIPIAPDCLGEE